ncbi:Aste57867_20097 [Aphanomyces stellatus]|uniref:Aste57867_20097 protein n=1 Tax=Aphanomyces stellatus TaxID=120398 RepID=A0A485LEB1_9STRA|nr:hypothetical protein As57867_020031 [Aphanomyces stellatus]VFT96792.1 Aste57867_20097 [Aphanomyces stellatus]
MSVHFKFKSEKEFGTVTFHGTSIRVIDLKKAIVEQKKLTKGIDMELTVTDYQTGTVYDDDDFQLPKNTSVIVKRMPVTNKPGILARIKIEQQTLCVLHATACLHQMIPFTTMTITCFFSFNVAYWSHCPHVDMASCGAETVEDEMAALNVIQAEAAEERSIRGPHRTWTREGGSKGPSIPARAPHAGTCGANKPNYDALPRGYVCRRCSVPGHFIQNCPKGDSNVPSIKPRTGIPESMTKRVQDATEAAGRSLCRSGPHGDLAVVIPQENIFRALVKRSGGGSHVEQCRQNPPPHLACPICKTLMRDAVLVPCCHESACDECIRSAVIAHNLTCPLCHKALTPDDLIPNKVTRKSVDDCLLRSQHEIHGVHESRVKTPTPSSTVVVRQDIADAVLDIPKKSKADESMDEDFGDDVFAALPEVEAEPELAVVSSSSSDAVLGETTTSPSTSSPVDATKEETKPCQGRGKTAPPERQQQPSHGHGPPDGALPPTWASAASEQNRYSNVGDELRTSARAPAIDERSDAKASGSERQKRSPDRHRKRSLERHRNQSPVRRRSRSHERNRDRSPKRRRNQSPEYRRNRSPASRRSRERKEKDRSRDRTGTAGRKSHGSRGLDGVKRRDREKRRLVEREPKKHPKASLRGAKLGNLKQNEQNSTTCNANSDETMGVEASTAEPMTTMETVANLGAPASCTNVGNVRDQSKTQMTAEETKTVDAPAIDLGFLEAEPQEKPSAPTYDPQSESRADATHNQHLATPRTFATHAKSQQDTRRVKKQTESNEATRTNERQDNRRGRQEQREDARGAKRRRSEARDKGAERREHRRTGEKKGGKPRRQARAKQGAMARYGPTPS